MAPSFRQGEMARRFCHLPANRARDFPCLPRPPTNPSRDYAAIRRERHAGSFVFPTLLSIRIGGRPCLVAMDLRSERPGDIRDAPAQRERRLDQLIDRLPKRWRSTVRWLRQPSRRWLRICAGVLSIVGSFLSILPVFGLWMLPLGLVLLAEDIRVLRRGRDRILELIEERRPHWFQPRQLSVMRAG